MSPPPMGWLKFNMDSAARCKPDPAGIGGVLQNHERQVLLTFPKSIGVRNLNEADVLTILEALRLYASSFHKLSIVESYSSNAT